MTPSITDLTSFKSWFESRPSAHQTIRDLIRTNRVGAFLRLDTRSLLMLVFGR